MEASHALLNARFGIHHATLQPEPMTRTVRWVDREPESFGNTSDMSLLASRYLDSLTALIEVWRIKGLDEDSGQQGTVGRIREQIAVSAIDAENQAQLLGLLENYERHFLAPVAHNDRVATLTQDIIQAAMAFAPLSRQHLDQAGQDLAADSTRLAAVTARQERINLLVVLGAIG